MSEVDLDTLHMARAIELGRQGDPSPNPHVGCVIAQGEEIVGEGHHATAGAEHAEVVALKAAGKKAKGATLYGTLEPCNHVGKTPPCVDAILAAGIKRVVVGRRDPNPRVTGGGIERLEQQGVEVKLGVLDQECKALIRPWAISSRRGGATSRSSSPSRSTAVSPRAPAPPSGSRARSRARGCTSCAGSTTR